VATIVSIFPTARHRGLSRPSLMAAPRRLSRARRASRRERTAQGRRELPRRPRAYASGLHACRGGGIGTGAASARRRAPNARARRVPGHQGSRRSRTRVGAVPAPGPGKKRGRRGRGGRWGRGDGEGETGRRGDGRRRGARAAISGGESVVERREREMRVRGGEGDEQGRPRH
jgi:hypothetical protein